MSTLEFLKSKELFLASRAKSFRCLDAADCRHCARRSRSSWMLGIRVHLVWSSLFAFRRRSVEPSMDTGAVANIQIIRLCPRAVRTSPRHLLGENNSRTDLARASTDHEAAKADLEETSKLGHARIQLLMRISLTSERVLSDFNVTILVRVPSAEKSAQKRTLKVQEISQAPSTLSSPGSQTAQGPRLLQVWRDGLHTFVADKLLEQIRSRNGTYLSWTLLRRFSFTVARKPTASKGNWPRWPLTSDSSRGMAWRCCGDRNKCHRGFKNQSLSWTLVDHPLVQPRVHRQLDVPPAGSVYALAEKDLVIGLHGSVLSLLLPTVNEICWSAPSVPCRCSLLFCGPFT